MFHKSPDNFYEFTQDKIKKTKIKLELPHTIIKPSSEHNDTNLKKKVKIECEFFDNPEDVEHKATSSQVKLENIIVMDGLFEVKFKEEEKDSEFNCENFNASSEDLQLLKEQNNELKYSFANMACGIKNNILNGNHSIFENPTIHNQVVMGPKSNVYDCILCGKSYSTKKNLKQHILSIHEKLKPFNCLECSYACSEKSSLMKHVKSVHEKIKTFKCLECNISFCFRFDLSRHTKSVHEKLKPYKCLFCDYACIDKPHLTKHIKFVHEKLKPFKCSICDYACSQKGHLISHVRSVHEKLKPFKCLDCKYSSSSKYGIARHIMTVHEKLKNLSA